jgi:hypothetical protein
MPKPSKDDVERLSRGMPTRAKIGSRNTGHRLTQKERLLFAAAQRQGFLKLQSLEFAQMFSTCIDCGVRRKDANALSRVAINNGRHQRTMSNT